MTGMSDKGLVRKRNEDSYWFNHDNRLAIIADGLGGHKRGDIASRETINYIKELAKQFENNNNLTNLMSLMLVDTSKHVRNLADSDNNLKGMSSTVICCYFSNEKLYIAHVGDSRIYLIDDNKIWQLSIDHNIKTMLERQQKSSFNANAPLHALTNVIGGRTCTPDVYSISLKKNQLYLLATDGLFNMVAKDDILKIVEDNSFENFPKKLIAQANKNGGCDNITIIGCLIS